MPGSRLEQAQFLRTRDRFDPAVHAKLAIDVADVGADGVDRDDEPAGNLWLTLSISFLSSS